MIFSKWVEQPDKPVVLVSRECAPVKMKVLESSLFLYYGVNCAANSYKGGAKKREEVGDVVEA